MEFLALVGEAAKGFFGAMGEAGAQALLASRSKHKEAEEEDPIFLALVVAEQFMDALHRQDHDGAWALCDPEWQNDPERNEALDATFSAAPPASWKIADEIHVPADWREGNGWPAWAAAELLVTFDMSDGTYEVMPALLWVVGTDHGWVIADIHWNLDAQNQADTPMDDADLDGVFDSLVEAGFEIYQEEPASHVIQCTRCPQRLSIPVGKGRLRVTCPSCWTKQFVDS